MREFIEMKKIFLIFLTVYFANMHAGKCEYFYSSSLERTITNEFAEKASAVMDAYITNMDPDTGEIDENGFYNVCYAGGYDVATEKGAEQCANFLEKLQDDKPKYSAPKYEAAQCPKSGVPALTKGCKYISTNNLKVYNNPATDAEKLQRCILIKTVDWAIDNYEGGYQHTTNDRGSTICKGGKPVYTDGTVGDWKNLDPNKTIELGATKFGITTCYNEFSIDCVCGMGKLHAKHYYWNIARNHGYFKFPIEVVAPIIQFSISGVGRVKTDLNKILGTKCSGTVMGDCQLNAFNNKYYTNDGKLRVQDFYNDICNAHAPKSTKSKNYRRAMETKGLIRFYDECKKELGIH